MHRYESLQAFVVTSYQLAGRLAPDAAYWLGFYITYTLYDCMAAKLIHH